MNCYQAKYSVGDLVFCLSDGEIRKVCVTEVLISENSDGCEISYNAVCDAGGEIWEEKFAPMFSENELFKEIPDLIAELMNNFKAMYMPKI